MSDIYELVRRRFADVMPKQRPVGLDVQKRVLRRSASFTPKDDFWVVLTGSIRDEHEDAGRRVIVRDYMPGDMPGIPVGKMRATLMTDLVILGPGWDILLPGLYFRYGDAIREQAKQSALRMIDTMTKSVTQRVAEFIEANPKIESPVVISRHIGASREMCSRAMKSIRGQA